MICFSVSVVSITLLRFLYAIENARREKLADNAAPGEDEYLTLTDQTDKENLKFRYVL